MLKKLVSGLIPAEPVHFLLLPSLTATSRTEDNRPPYFSGIALLYKSTDFTRDWRQKPRKIQTGGVGL